MYFQHVPTISPKQKCGGFQSHGGTPKFLMVYNGKSHRSKWMMTRGVPPCLWKPPCLVEKIRKLQESRPPKRSPTFVCVRGRGDLSSHVRLVSRNPGTVWQCHCQNMACVCVLHIMCRYIYIYINSKSANGI